MNRAFLILLTAALSLGVAVLIWWLTRNGVTPEEVAKPIGPMVHEPAGQATPVPKAPSAETTERWANATHAVDIYAELLERASAGDGEAALRAVSIEERCGQGAVTEDFTVDLVAGVEAAREQVNEAEPGRGDFNQLLLYVGDDARDSIDVANYISESFTYCNGFTGRIERASHFELLITAARTGSNDARVALWKAPYQGSLHARVAHLKDPNNLEYLRYAEAEREWEEWKLQMLEAAGASGDARAWVYLGEVYSSEAGADLTRAYGYYLAAAREFDYGFLWSRLTLLESQLTPSELGEAENVATTLTGG